VDAHDQYFFVVGAIENADLAAFRNALMRSPEVIVFNSSLLGVLKA